MAVSMTADLVPSLIHGVPTRTSCGLPSEPTAAAPRPSVAQGGKSWRVMAGRRCVEIK